MYNPQDKYIQKSGWTQDKADANLYNFYRDFYDNEVSEYMYWQNALTICPLNAKDLLADNTLDDLKALGLYDPETHMIAGYYCIGSVFSVMPSQKYWTLWAGGNINRKEAIQDTAFIDALEHEAESRDMWIENDENDPTLLNIWMWVDTCDL